MSCKIRRGFTDTLASFLMALWPHDVNVFRTINTCVFNFHNLDTRQKQRQFSGFFDKQGIVE